MSQLELCENLRKMKNNKEEHKMTSNELKALQQGSQEASTVLSESQSPETTEQERVTPTPKSTDACTYVTATTQDHDNSPKPPEKNQTNESFTIAGVMLLDDEEMSVITLAIKNIFSGKVKFDKVRYEGLTPTILRKCVTKNGGLSTDWKGLYDVLMQDIKEAMEHGLIKVEYGHTKLGWSKREDSIVFYCQQMISVH